MVSKTSLVSSWIYVRRPIHFPQLKQTQEVKFQEWEERENRAQNLFQLWTYYSKELNGHLQSYSLKLLLSRPHYCLNLPFYHESSTINTVVKFFFILHLAKMPPPILFCGTQANPSLLSLILSPLGILSLLLKSPPTLLISYVSLGQPWRQGTIWIDAC